MELMNLNNLKQTLEEKYRSEFDPRERVLPEKFKNRVRTINSNTIIYQNYTMIIEAQKAKLYSYIPNQWFYIAAFFCDYYNQLQLYREKVFGLVNDKEKIRSCYNNEDYTRSLLDSVHYNNSVDKEWLISFLFDYSWWGGAKTIDRNDFYVSPILSMANVVNASQSFIAEICKFLAQNPQELAILENEIGRMVKKEALKEQTVLVENESRPYITAIKSKPFILLAGISGTGKSRIVRQLAYATGGEDSNKIQKPYNYEIIQVRPNWHDSTELLGYETRISGRAEYVVTDFLRFLAKAWYFEEVPFFLCLDEMNLAPVEQYFAEYLSVLETRKLRDGDIVSDTLLPALSKYDEKNEETGGIDNPILNDLFGKEWRINGDVVQRNKAREAKLVEKFRVDGITLPPNLIVMGTVNMDETTFSFSRKVLDRAMTIEMNGVDFSKGLMREDCRIAPIAADVILPDAVEAMDVYEANQAVCDVVIAYLNEINSVLEGTPFKVAYRTRNEFILYVLANLQYTGNDTCYKLIRALDEMTLMKILSRIEGDKNKLMNLGKTGSILDDLTAQIKQSLEKVYQDFDASGSEKSMYVDLGKDSVSLCKLGEMKRKLDNTYYCTFWS
mgnify:CR=1 FL=1